MLKRFTFDLETHLIEPGNIIPQGVAGGFSKFDGAGYTEPQLATLEEIQGELLQAFRDQWVVVGHRIVYDLAVMWRHFPMLGDQIYNHFDKGLVSCTAVREKLIKCAEGRLDYDHVFWKAPPRFSMEALAKEYLDLDLSGDKNDPNAWRLRYGELDGVPFSEWPKEAVDYLLNDVRITDALWLKQAEGRNGSIYMDNFRVVNESEQVKADWVLQLITAWGLVTDKQRVEDLELKLATEMTQLSENLKRIGLVKPNGKKDTKATRAAVEKAYLAQGLEVPTTAKGNIKTDADTLKEANDENLNKVIEYNHTQKLLTTFVQPVLKQGVTGTIHPNYDVLKATGRTSSYGTGKGKNKLGCNIQQLPRKGGVRECFRPRPGNLFIDCDYSTLELACLSQVCYSLFGYSHMRDALLKGLDLHVVTAASLMGIEPEVAQNLFNEGDKEVKEMRQLAKVPNFGFPGGMGAPKLVLFAKQSYGQTITLEKAQELRGAWLAAYPEMNNYFNFIAERVNNPNNYGDLIQLFSNRVRGKATYTQMANSFFQGLAADGIKYAMWLISRECYLVPSSPLFGTRINAMVHDELLAEAPENKAPEAAERMAELMVQGMKLYLPDVPVVAEPVLMRYWYKDAETVRDSNGRLIPWEPENES